MLALLSLLFLVCAQAALTIPLEGQSFAWQGLGELSDILIAEKRYAINSVAGAKEVPKPTTTPPPTTTTTLQARQPYGKEHPTDIFSPATLGTVTSFITEVTLAERVEEGFRAALTVPLEDARQELTELSNVLTAACGKKHPTDINFIFSPAALGLDESSTVTSFISQVTLAERVEEGFKYGVLSADCPRDAGFHLNTYSVTEKLRDRLNSYDRNNLPALVSQAAREGFGPQHGGRLNAKKVAVIFLGTVKVSTAELKNSIQKLQDEGVKVYVSVPQEEMVGTLIGSLPFAVTFLTGGPPRQVAQLLRDLCPNPDK